MIKEHIRLIYNDLKIKRETLKFILYYKLQN